MTAAERIHHTTQKGQAMHTPELRGIDPILGLLDNGAYHPTLLADIAKLVSEMQDFSRAFGGVKASGTLDLKLSFRIDRFGQIDLEAGHKISTPKAPKSKGVAWTTEDGGLTPANPNQMALPLRDVSAARDFRSPGASHD